MSRSLRRFSAAAFAVWFAVFGASRGLIGVCPVHPAGHGSEHGNTSAHTSASADVASDPHAAHHAAASLSAPSVDSGDTESDAGACDCRGECCSSAPVRDTPPTTIVSASIVRVATPRTQPTLADRPTERIAYLLPFATAPPRQLTA